MNITTYPLGPLQTNCFLLSKNGQAVVVDPGGDPDVLLRRLQEDSLQLTHILNTHLHFDHVYGNKALSDATGVPIFGSTKDMYLLETEIGKGGAMGLPLVEDFQLQPVEPGEMELAGENCLVLSTPGHSPGSLSFYFPESKAVFSGDLIFNRSIGRTDFPGGDYNLLVSSVREKIFTLPDETVIYSGHGPRTTVGDERNHNPFFQDM